MNTESHPPIDYVDLQAAVDRLPARQREELLLHVNELLTCDEIAQRMGLPRRVVLRDLARAYSALSMELSLENSSAVPDADEAVWKVCH